MKKHFLTLSILFTIIIFLVSIMYQPPVLFEKYREELFFMAGSMLVYSVMIRKKITFNPILFLN